MAGATAEAEGQLRGLGSLMVVAQLVDLAATCGLDDLLVGAPSCDPGELVGLAVKAFASLIRKSALVKLSNISTPSELIT